MTHTQLMLGDSEERLKELNDNSVDSVVCDPPYGLSFMGKRWDYELPSIEVWKECLRVLKPGGHLLAFSSPRTYHRLVVTIEDAGFEIRDQIMWVYGSGFPKSHNIGKSIDKLQGNEREVVGERKQSGAKFKTWSDDPNETRWHNQGYNDQSRTSFDLTKGNSDWEGWGTALKPSHEPIVLARKPISEKNIAQNVLKWGTGGLNIDKSRVTSDDVVTTHSKSGSYDDIYSVYGKVETHQTAGQELGRFPANFIHDGSQGVLDLFPDNAGNGWKKNYGEENYKGMNYDSSTNQCVFGGGFTGNNTYCDSGSAARFFYNVADDVATAPSFYYCAKASKKERGEENNHPTVKPQALMTYLINLVTPPGGVVLDPFMGSGSTGVAAVTSDYNFIGVELDKDYLEIATQRINESTLSD